MSVVALSARDRVRCLVALIAGSFAAGVGMGTMNPLITLLLAQRGVDNAYIGLNAALVSAAILIGGPFVPRFVRAMGAFRALLFTVVVDAVLLVLYPGVEAYWAWCVFRFLGGLVGVAWWVVTESWINLLADDARRTRVVGLYTTMLALSMAVGPLVIAETGIDGVLPWLVILAILAISAVPVMAVARRIPVVAHDENLPALALVRRVPLVMMAAIFAGFADYAIMALLPIYGLERGLPPMEAAALLTAFTLGNVALTLPIGWFADKVSRRAALALCVIVAIACAAALPLAVADRVALWAVLFLWGGSVFAIYAVALGMLGAAFDASQIVAANAAFIVIYNLGGSLGPLVTGGAMDLWAPEALPATVALAMAVVLAFMFIRRAR